MTLSACPVPPVVIVNDKTEDGQRPDPGKRRRRREGLNVSQTRGAGNRRASVAANAKQAPLVRRAVTKSRVHGRHVTFSPFRTLFYSSLNLNLRLGSRAQTPRPA